MQKEKAGGAGRKEKRREVEGEVRPRFRLVRVGPRESFVTVRSRSRSIQCLYLYICTYIDHGRGDPYPAGQY